eukprot:scaffold3013_cov316-Prasinococcus_capsulatus_cf.AAC.6
MGGSSCWVRAGANLREPTLGQPFKWDGFTKQRYRRMTTAARPAMPAADSMPLSSPRLGLHVRPGGTNSTDRVGTFPSTHTAATPLARQPVQRSQRERTKSRHATTDLLREQILWPMI